MTRDVLRSSIIACSIMVIGAGLGIGQGQSMSQEKASSPPISQAAPFVYLIPQAAHIPGDKGSNWRTDAVLHNGRSFGAAARIYFLKADSDNSAAESVSVTVNEHSSLKLVDIVRTVFGQEKSVGALLIGSDQDLVITSRTYNDDPKGTFGQYVEGYPAATAIKTSEEVRLIGLAENATRRTNLGFVNITEKAIDIRVTMYKADGLDPRLGTMTYKVPPYGFIKKDKIIKWDFKATNVDDAFAVISTSTKDAQYFAYASVTDNLSNDPVCIIPVGRAQANHPTEIQDVPTVDERANADGIDGQSVVRDDHYEMEEAKRLRDIDQWQPIGPWGGGVEAMAVDPFNPQIVYASMGKGGVYKTANGGGSWVVINNGLRDFVVKVLAIDPNRPEILYAGTEGGGVFKSTNGGLTWAATNAGLFRGTFTVISIDPVDSQILYVGAGYRKLYRSTNGGESWTLINNGLADSYINHVVIDPTNPQTLYLATYCSGVYKTTNSGESWVNISEGSLIGQCINSLAIDPTSPQTVYAGIDYDSGVAKTTNGGLSWRIVNTGLSNRSLQALAIDPTNPQNIYVGTYPHRWCYCDSGVFKSTNGGSSWLHQDNGQLNSWVNVIAIAARNSKMIYAGTSIGVMRSNDGGGSWIPVNPEVSSMTVKALAIDPAVAQQAYAVISAPWFAGGGIFKTIDGGGAWSASNKGLFGVETPAFAIDPAHPQNAYFATSDGIYKTTNSGFSWFRVNGWRIANDILTLAIDPASSQIVYAGTSSGIFKTTDGGDSWFAINNGLSNPRVLALIIDPSNPRNIYLGTYGSGVFKTTDAGGTWAEINTGLLNLKVTALAIDPNNPQIVYAGANGVSTVMQKENCIFKTTNGGISWTATNNGLAGKSIRSIAIDPTNSGVIFAGTEDGVYKKTNGGDKWTPINAGLSDLSVRVVAIDTNTPQTIYAGTENSGVLKKILRPCNFNLDQTSARYSRPGGTGIIEVMTESECPWTATSNDQWITITSGSSGTASGVVSYYCSYNTSGNPRSGTLSVAGQTFTISQGTTCAEPPAPTLTAATTANSGQRYLLHWTITSPTDRYELQEATTPDFSGATIRVLNGPDFATSHIAIVPTTYMYRIRNFDVCDGITFVSPWSDPIQIVVSPGKPAIFLPAAAHGVGLVGTHWRTDLEVHNPGETFVGFDIVLLKKDQSNMAPMSKPFSLGPYKSVQFADVLKTLFDFTGSATLGVIPSDGGLMAIGRTYNLLAAGNPLGLPGGATFGQFIPGKTDADAVAYGQVGRLVQLAQSVDDESGFRTNIGLSSAVAFPITIEIRLFRGDGAFIGGKTKILPPFGATQVNAIFRDVITTNIDDGFAEVTTITPDGRFLAYASVTDNKSGDPIYIPAVVR